MTSPKENLLRDQKGQTFVEFIFILVLLITISFTFMRGFNHLVGVRWEIMLKIIARPNASEVVFP
ncbi:MAG: hypothetical protein H7281_14965 [Bacteriovorax sp.]|nr:hypothetical protein [Bacteriovorax sp.]